MVGPGAAVGFTAASEGRHEEIAPSSDVQLEALAALLTDALSTPASAPAFPPAAP